ncbi:MAG: ABC transporter permease [Acidobacteria bacterium]|nr:ABC transporter permease [Acidobacteriota bacterium]
MQTLIQDLRYGARMLLKNPGFTLTAIITLALGIGANTAIFSVIDGVLFRPLPYSNPDRLVFIWGRHAQQGDQLQQVSYLDFTDIRAQNEVFDDVAAMLTGAWTLSNGTGESSAERVGGMLISPELFRLLGVGVAAGRAFLPEEGQPGKDRVVMLGHRLWQRRFGSDPSRVGKPITLDGESYLVVGVLPPGIDLEFPLDPSFTIENNDIWMPLTSAHHLAGNRAIFTFEVIARLKPGIDLRQAQTSLATIGRRLEEAHLATNKGRSFTLVRALDHMVGQIRPTLLVLLAAVGAVLLIACANVANLLLGRTATRQREIAVRAALGAGRWRIIRHLLTESLLLALLGGLAGLLLAVWTVDLLANFSGTNLPRMEEIRVDYRVFGFTCGLSLLTGMLFGLAPALIASRSDLQLVLKEGGQKMAGQRRASSLMVVSEVALALILLVTAGLLTRSFVSLLNVNPGFKTENALTFKVSPPAGRYPDLQKTLNYYRQLVTRLESLPGVRSVGVVRTLPLSGSNIGSALRIEGRTLAPGEQPPGVGWQAALPGYFQMMGIPLLRGRDFLEEDYSRSQHVTIINETVARRFFPNEDPIGKRVTYGLPGPQPDWHEIIGVVGDVRHLTLDAEPDPRAYDLFGQSGGRAMFVVIRTTGDPSDVTALALNQVRELDPEVPVYEMTTLSELLARSAAPRSFSMLLVGGFALIALALAAVGIYGVLSYSVSQRTPEIGIRLALGAQTSDVLRLTVVQGMKPVLIGIAIGVVAAIALTRLTSKLLYGVSATDLVTYTGVASLLAVVALVACYIPARRATKVDPMVALRYQ